MEEKTNRELTQILLRKLIDLQIELAAMRSFLSFAKFQDASTQRQLDWQSEVAHHRAGITQDVPLAIYADIEEKLLVSTVEYPDAIRLLIELAERPIPIEPKK